MQVAVLPDVLRAQDPTTGERFQECLSILEAPESDAAKRVLAASDLLKLSGGHDDLRGQVATRLTAGSAVHVVTSLLAAIEHDGESQGLTPALLELLEDQRKVADGETATVRQKVLITLQALLDRDTEGGLVRELVGMVREDEPAGRRTLALRALEELRPPTALPLLTALWVDPGELPAGAHARLGHLCEDYFGGRTARMREELVGTKQRYYELLETKGRWRAIAADLQHWLPEVAALAVAHLDRIQPPEALGAVASATVFWLQGTRTEAGAPQRAALATDLLQLFRSLGPRATPEDNLKAIEQLLGLLESSPDLAPGLRLDLCRAAVSQQPAARDIPGDRVVQLLVSGFTKETDEGRRGAYVDLMAELGNAAAVYYLLSDIMQEPPTLASKILQSMLQYEVEAIPFKDGEIQARVLECASHDDVRVRQAAMLVIAQLGLEGDKVFEILLRTMQDPKMGDAVRIKACQLLGAYDRTEDLLRLLREEEVSRVRQHLAHELGRVASRFTSDDGEEITARRITILEALAAALPDATERAALLEAGQHTANDDAEALLRLGQLLLDQGAPEAVIPLERAMELEVEPEAEVRRQGRELLARALLLVGTPESLMRARGIFEELLEGTPGGPEDAAVALLAGRCYRLLAGQEGLEAEQVAELRTLASQAYLRARDGFPSTSLEAAWAMVEAGHLFVLLGDDGRAREHLQHVEAMRSSSEEIQADTDLATRTEELRRLLEDGEKGEE